MSYPTTSSSTPTTPNNYARSGFTNDDQLSVRSYGSVTVIGTPSQNGSTYKIPMLDDVASPEEMPLISAAHLAPRTRSWELSLKEAWLLLRYAVPVVCTALIEYSLVITSIVTVGRLSTETLAGASLGSMTAGVTGFSIIQGFACALDSLLPAAWTGANPSHVGLWTQRMLVLMAFLLVPISVIWSNVEHIFLRLRQDPQVASLAAVYLKYSIPQLPAYAFNAVIRRYFQAQGLLHVPSFITLTVAPINVGLNYALVWGPEPIRIGFIGAPVATSISLTLMSVLYVVYAVCFTSHKAWRRISTESFRSLPKLLSMALIGVGQSAAEWWSWEFISLGASQLGPVALAAQSVLVMTSSTVYQIPYALGVASSVRVGNLLGANSVAGAAIASRVAAGMALFGGLISASMFMLARHKISYIYTSDDQIAALVADILPLVAAYQIVDGLAAVTAGMLRACGKLGTGAVSNFIGFYVIGIPLGFYLTFWQGCGLKGLWIGLATALVFVAAVLGTVVLWLDWEVQVKQAKERVGDKATPGEESAQV
ncbi:hypothetical protein FRC09_018556 [Ceratobasidium sp. 395]|nr:hypothetical protein FRC09_018556 [Ceratobasidium sp. 395]